MCPKSTVLRIFIVFYHIFWQFWYLCRTTPKSKFWFIRSIFKVLVYLGSGLLREGVYIQNPSTPFCNGAQTEYWHNPSKYCCTLLGCYRQAVPGRGCGMHLSVRRTPCQGAFGDASPVSIVLAEWLHRGFWHCSIVSCQVAPGDLFSFLFPLVSCHSPTAVRLRSMTTVQGGAKILGVQNPRPPSIFTTPPILPHLAGRNSTMCHIFRQKCVFCAYLAERFPSVCDYA